MLFVLVSAVLYIFFLVVLLWELRASAIFCVISLFLSLVMDNYSAFFLSSLVPHGGYCFLNFVCSVSARFTCAIVFFFSSVAVS